MSVFQSLARRIGLPPLDFEIGEESRGKIMRASVLPAAVLLARLVQVLLEISYSQGDLFDSDFGGAPETVVTLYRFVINIQSIQLVALASLFAFGILVWTRAEGSWAFAIALCLAGVSLVGAGFVALIELVSENRNLWDDVRVFSWQQLASTCGLLSVGYFFLAYRGLAQEPPRRVPRRIRRRAPGPGAAGTEAGGAGEA